MDNDKRPRHPFDKLEAFYAEHKTEIDAMLADPEFQRTAAAMDVQYARRQAVENRRADDLSDTGNAAALPPELRAIADALHYMLGIRDWTAEQIEAQRIVHENLGLSWPPDIATATPWTGEDEERAIITDNDILSAYNNATPEMRALLGARPVDGHDA